MQLTRLCVKEGSSFSSRTDDQLSGSTSAEETDVELASSGSVEHATVSPSSGCTGADIQLETGIEASLCRRGRRRLKELQAGNPGAKIRFDRRRKVLRVIGTPEMIEAS